MVFAPFQTLCTTLNSVVSIASKSVYGQEWGQKSLDEAGIKGEGRKMVTQKLSYHSKKNYC